MKKKLFVGAAVGSAGLVALTGATFAQTEGETPSSGIRDRVAEILGIAPEELEDAVQQAREEHSDAKLAERLATAVEEGVITQDEADEMVAWLDAMPEALEGVKGHGKRGFGHVAGADDSDEQIAELVERLIEAEKITEDDAAAVTEWLGDAPTEVLSKLYEAKDDGEGRGHGFRGRMFGEGPGGRQFEGRFQIRPYSPPAEPATDGGEVNVVPVSVGQSA